MQAYMMHVCMIGIVQEERRLAIQPKPGISHTGVETLRRSGGDGRVRLVLSRATHCLEVASMLYSWP